MEEINKFYLHLKTIIKHRHEVMKWCFKLEIPWRGLVHDLSKFSPTELSIYKYYTGTHSPHDEARKVLGYSPSWIHHKTHNKHHWEYWLDNETKKFYPIKMPYKYLIEMVCDFIGAGKVYLKDKWTPSSPLEYHLKCKNNRLYHPDTLNAFEYLLTRLSELGETEFVQWYHIHKKILKYTYENNIKKDD